MAWLGRMTMLDCLAVAVLLSTVQGPEATAAAGAKTGTIDPAKILRKAAASADTLVVESEPFREQKSRVLLRVEDRAEIAELLGLVDTPPIEANVFMHHMCSGHPKISFSRGAKVVAVISFDHAQLLRPYSKGLWGGTDVELTEASARAMAKWFARHGLPSYQQEIDAEDEKRDRRRAFHAAFPPRTLAAVKADGRGFDWVTSGGADEVGAPDCASEALAPMSVELPNQVEQARVLFRALGHLDGSWSSYTEAEARVLRWAKCIAPSQLAKAVDAAASDPVEQLGAARVLFGVPARLFYRLERPTAERLALKVVPAVVAQGDVANARELPLLLAGFESKSANGLLTRMAAHAAEVEDSPCWNMSRASTALSALLVLAERRAADPAVLKKASQRTWQCGANRHAALVAAALAADRLPDAHTLEEADLTATLTTLARIKRHPTPEGETLVREVLLPHRWGIVRNEAKQWLAHLTRARLDQESRDR